MQTKRDRLFHCLFTVALVASGCVESSTVDPSVSASIEEPTTVDAPNASAAQQFHRAANQNSSAKANQSWPQLFGADRTSVVATEINPFWGPEGPPKNWSLKIGTGYGSPVVADGNVVFNHRIEDEEIIQCVDAKTGETVWKHAYPTTFETEFDYSNGPYSTPVIANGQVFSAGGQGQFFCLNATTGDLIWSRDLHQEYALEDDIFAVGSTPLLVGNRLIFNLGAAAKNAGVVALDRNTGTTMWESTNHGAAYCSPFAANIHGKDFVFVVTEIGLVSMHPDTGEVDWSIEHRSRSPMSFNAVSPLVDGDKVLVVTGPGPGAVCVRVLPDRSYQPLWKDRRVIDCQFNSLMLHSGHVFGFTAAGQGGAEFRCVDFETGELRWKYHSLLRRGQGLIAGNAILLLGEQGHLASLLLSQESPQVISFTNEPLISSPGYCAPALAAGRLFLKEEYRLTCFDVTPTTGRHFTN